MTAEMTGEMMEEGKDEEEGDEGAIQNKCHH